MYSPIAIPGQVHSGDPQTLLNEIQRWIASDPLRALVERWHGAPTDTGTTLQEQLAYLDGFSAAAWYFRKEGEERNQIDTEAVIDEDEDFVKDAADALGLVRSRPPRHEHYDHIIMLGGLVRANLWRPAYAAHLLANGTSASQVVAISAYRPLARNPKNPVQDEYALLDHFGLPHRKYEYQVMEDGVRRAFGLPEFEIDQESAPEVEGNFRYHVSSSTTHDRKVTLVVAPTKDPSGSRRADTPASYQFWAGEVAHIKPTDRVLAVTSTIYVPFQHAVALQHLALPFGCEVDTVGIDSAVIDDGGMPQTFRGVNYLLEIRSTVRAFRKLVGMIAANGTNQ
jgi:hypothetical protein